MFLFVLEFTAAAVKRQESSVSQSTGSYVHSVNIQAIRLPPELPMTVSKLLVVKSADRVLDVLEHLVRRGRGATHASLSTELRIPKSSLSKLLGNLVDRGYLSLNSDQNLYEIGPRLTQLVERQTQVMSLPRIAQRCCDKLTKETGESSSFNVLVDQMSERMCGANSNQSLTFNMRVGEKAPLYAVSSGKVLLAAMTEPELKEYLSKTPLTAFTNSTLTTRTALRSELHNVRETGFAWSIEEYTQGIIAVAKPVLDVKRNVVGSMNIAFPAARDNAVLRMRLTDALQLAAESMQTELSL